MKHGKLELRTVLVTGGAGFIGSAVCRSLIACGARVVNLDKLTYAADPAALRDLDGSASYRFVRGDIGAAAAVLELLREERADAILHLAAETHVDRSIDAPAAFVETNVAGTVRLLEAAVEYWRGLTGERHARFRFHHVSTDEVFGALPLDGGGFTQASPYAPSSPYSASKAASDHFVRAWYTTHRLPVVLSNSSNNYGPRQFPEKLIPLAILNAIEGLPIPLYGQGANVRDWLHVDDHARALCRVLAAGRIGATYLVGARAERTNLHVVETICDLLDARLPTASPRRRLIAFVADRPGHDLRYAIDPDRIEAELGWRPQVSFESGLADTIDWYLANRAWWEPIRAGARRDERLGLGRAYRIGEG